MKLFFDARYIRTDYHDGISRYSAELGSALARLTDVTFLICDQRQLDHLPQGVNYKLIHKPTSPKEPLTALILNRFKPDVVFSPMQTMGAMGRRFKLILTLHDMIYYHHRKPPTALNPALRAGWWLFHAAYWPQRLVLNQADVIVTVSQTSRDEIVATKLTKRPVVVVPNAPNDLRRYLDKDVDVAKQPRNLVYMGSFMPYKNVETLIKAMKYLPEFKLHLLSRISEAREAELRDQIDLPSGEIVFHRGVSDETYAQLLADRALQVSASLLEGYGLPIAEAMTLGVPSVISDTPVFHEVGGDGALYFDPHSPRDFADKVKQAGQLKEYKRLSKQAKAISQKFSWSESAKTLLATIENTLRND